MHDSDDWKALIPMGIALILILIIGGFLLLHILRQRSENDVTNASEQTFSDFSSDTSSEDMINSSETASGIPDGDSSPQATPSDSAGSPEIRQLVSDRVTENGNVTLGIDVSRYQGTIDWEQVSHAGVTFAMIRVGQRRQESGEIEEDSNARYNLQEALRYGIKVGVYFFSSAVSEEEAKEEAVWVADLVAPYSITYPVVYNCEGYLASSSRQYGLDREERTAIARAFLQQIYESGYTPMFYASKSELENENQWITSSLESSYKIWVAWYARSLYPETERPEYSGSRDMWQYTDKGSVDGIPGEVDLNVAYFGYEGSAKPMEQRALEEAFPDVEGLMNFTEVHETVTAKDATNLRDIPGQGPDSTVQLTLQNGQTATRTGISDSGWSRVEYNGQIYYAVSNYLTTDLTVRTKVPEPQEDGIKTVFTAVNEQVTPKIEVNLRTLPSVTNPDATIVATIPAGTVVTRTGINTEVGWSRVEYNGQTLYCVSSYVSVVEQD